MKVVDASELEFGDSIEQVFRHHAKVSHGLREDIGEVVDAGFWGDFFQKIW